MRGLHIVAYDAEPARADSVVEMLRSLDEVEDIVPASSGPEVLMLARELRPDLLFMDVDMPGAGAIDVIEAIAAVSPECAPFVVLQSDSRGIAAEAFDRGALDFLAKPVPQDRLADAIARGERAVMGRQAKRRFAEAEASVVEPEAAEAADAPADAGHLWVPRHGKKIRVDHQEIQRIAADGPYVHIHTKLDSYLHRASMAALERRLDPGGFARVHRSHLVRIDQVRSIRRNVGGTSEVILRSGECLPLGRKYAHAARRAILGRGQAL